jgi:hypothetical protein
MKEGKIKGKERSKKKKILRSLKKLKRVKNTLPLIFKLEKKKRHSRDQSCLTLSPDREAVSKIKPPPLSLSTSVKARNGELIEGRFRQRRRGFKRRQNTF